VASKVTIVQGTDGTRQHVCQMWPAGDALRITSVNLISGPRALIRSWYKGWRVGASKIKGLPAYMMAVAQPTAFMEVRGNLLQIGAAARPSKALTAAIAKSMSILRGQLR
jgi:hypothetical protein